MSTDITYYFDMRSRMPPSSNNASQRMFPREKPGSHGTRIPETATPAVQLVVNVDDLGLHPAVLRAVLRAHAAGVVTSASLQTNMPYAEEAMHATRELPGLGIGVHLNVLRGRPVLPTADVSTLLNAKGFFPGRYASVVMRLLAGRLRLDEVEREWAAQIERALALGVQPTHLDSEKHLHCWPVLFQLTCRLAVRFGIPWVRRIREPLPARWDGSRLRAQFLNALQRRIREAPAGVRFVDVVWGVARNGTRLNFDGLAADLAALPNVRIAEVICHPGDPRADDQPLPPGCGTLHAPAMWSTELERLLAPDALAFTRHPAVRLCHFGEIAMANPENSYA